MTVFLVGRRSGAARPGGDAMQMLESAEVGRAAGLDVQVVHDAAALRPAPGDVVHLFCLQRCHDWGDLPERAAAAGARLVLTPLWHPLERYHRRGRRGLAGLASKVLPDADRMAGLRWGRTGVRARAADIVERADLVLLAHEDERALLPAPPRVDQVVPVAIADAVEPPASVHPAPAEFVLCVGRIEPLKNSEAVFAAATDLGLPVVFVGSAAGVRHAGYGRTLRSRCWLGPLPYPEVRDLMGRARVHALASWTEVVGRSTLEAARAGAAVVMSNVGFAPAYLGAPTDGAWAFEPGDDRGLRDSLAAAWERGRDDDSDLVRRVRADFTWNTVGPTLVEAWKSAGGLS